MKKVLLLGAVAAFTLASCSKNYTCTCNAGEDTESVSEYTDLGKVEAEALETSCQLAGCTWEKA